MNKSSKWMRSMTLILVLFFAVIGLIGAHILDKSESGISAVSETDDPAQVALQVIDNYFEKLKHPDKNMGTPVESYRVLEVDSSNPDRIRVATAVTYTSSLMEMPASNFYIFKRKGEYFIESEKVVFDMITSSPTYGTILSGVKINEN